MWIQGLMKVQQQFSGQSMHTGYQQQALAVGVAKQLYNVPRGTKCKERSLTRHKHGRSAKEKEVQEMESERALGVLGLPVMRECKSKEEEQDSDDSTDTVRLSPPKSVIRRSESLKLPVAKRKRKTLRRAASLPPPDQQGLKGDKLGTLPLPPIGGGIVKTKRKKTKVGKKIGCGFKGRDSCDCQIAAVAICEV